MFQVADPLSGERLGHRVRQQLIPSPQAWGPPEIVVRLDGPADLLFDILRRSPPVVWRDPDRRRLWCSYLATQIVERLVAFSPGASRQRAEAEEVIAGMLFLGPAPGIDAFARGAWAQSATQQILACLHPLLERTGQNAS